MNDPIEKNQPEESALFRFSLIAPLIHLKENESKEPFLTQITDRTYDIPGSSKKKISKKTLLNYLKRYKNATLAGLFHKQRSDKNTVKGIGKELLEYLVFLKTEEPKRSTRQVIELALGDPRFKDCYAAERTLCRIFSAKGLHRYQIKPKKIHRLFEMDTINELWEADISDGIFLPSVNKMTYLFAFIDDYSRIVPHAQFYLMENLPCLEDCFKKAILKRGIPKTLYADNGRVYLSSHLKRICADLGVVILNHLPYSPQSKGKIERFFGRTQVEFYTEARHVPIQSLEELNSFFTAWLEVNYHRREHDSLGCTPLDRFTEALKRTKIKEAGTLEEITEIFLFRIQRSVHPHSGIVKLHGNRYQATDESLLGRIVDLRYDPFDLSRVFIYQKNVFHSVIYPVDLENRRVISTLTEENSHSEQTIKESSIEFFSRLKQKENELLKQDINSIDYENLNGKE